MSAMPKVTEANIPEHLRAKACPHMLPALMYFINTGEDLKEAVGEHVNACQSCQAIIDWGFDMQVKALGEPRIEPSLGMVIPLDETSREGFGYVSHCLGIMVLAVKVLLLFCAVALIATIWLPPSLILIGFTVAIICAYAAVEVYAGKAIRGLKSLVSHSICTTTVNPTGQNNSTHIH